MPDVKVEVKTEQANQDMTDLQCPPIDRNEQFKDFKKVHDSPDPETGTVRVYGQVHKRPESSTEALLSIGQHQAELFERLQSDKPRHIFVEGLAVEDEQHNLEILKIVKQQIEYVFPDGIDVYDLSEEQQLFLAQYGAADIYAATTPGVTIHGTSTAETIKKYTEGMAKLDEDPVKAAGQENYWIREFREKEAMTLVQKYLEKNPGAEVAMVYGTAHVWGPEDFPNQDKLPDIEVVSASENMGSPYEVGEALSRNMGNDLEQKSIVEAAEHIESTFLFCLKEDALFIRALDKAYVDTRLLDKEQYFKWMCEGCDHFNRVAVKADLQERYKTNQPPFSQFEPKADVMEYFRSFRDSEYRDFDENEYIGLERHIPTQNQMVREAKAIDPLVIEAIRDPRVLEIALDKIDTTYSKKHLLEGKDIKEVRRELYALVKGGLPPREDVLYADSVGPENMKFVVKAYEKLESMYKDNTGPFADITVE